LGCDDNFKAGSPARDAGFFAVASDQGAIRTCAGTAPLLWKLVS
jgi:hypothetical protein